ncbi:MAG: right-handed parallel beta-helix repeat-containing protein [bacterium]
MYVSVRFDAPTDVADTLRANTTWDGLVQVTGDIVVAPGVALTATENARVYCKAKDLRHASKDAGKTEITVRGKVDVQGATGSPVKISSSRDSAFDHFLGELDAAAAVGDWYGFRFDLVGCERGGAAYGYAGCLQPISSVDHASIAYGKVGIAIENYCAPSIKNTTFSHILDAKDIYLDSTDVFIPHGHWANGVCDSVFVDAPGEWSLTAGTNVVASTGGCRDGWIGATGKVDLVADGRLTAAGNNAAGDSVYFRPATVTSPSSPNAGKDWGGITLGRWAPQSSLQYAQVGNAATPIYVERPDSVFIRHSRVHHFADTGIWAKYAEHRGITIANCVVDRGEDLYRELGGTGIYVDQADSAHVAGNQVLLWGRDKDEGGTGISVWYGKTFCLTGPPSHRGLLLEDNFVMGPQGTPQYGSAYSGLKFDWPCGSTLRSVSALENWSEDWEFAGMEFQEPSDVQVNCNRVVQSKRDVDIYRSDATGSAIRFKNNAFEALTADSAFFALRTNDAVKTKLGPAQSDRGANVLTVNLYNTKFIYETDTGATDTLDARNNYWATDSLGTRTLLADSTEIENRLAPPGYLIKIAGFYTEPVNPPCEATRPGDAPADTAFPRAFVQGPRRASLDEDVALAAAEDGLTQKLELSTPYPNPGANGVNLQLAVPKDRTGTYVLEVFDVGGRRLLDSRREVAAPGRYPISWAGRDSRGQQVGAGVYFLRLRGPSGFVEMRKVTVVR